MPGVDGFSSEKAGGDKEYGFEKAVDLDHVDFVSKEQVAEVDDAEDIAQNSGAAEYGDAGDGDSAIFEPAGELGQDAEGVDLGFSVEDLGQADEVGFDSAHGIAEAHEEDPSDWLVCVGLGGFNARHPGNISCCHDWLDLLDEGVWL